MHALLAALRSLRREWRAGELAILLLSLIVAIGALTGVGFLVDRIGRAVQLTASEVLAADLRIEADRPLDAREAATAKQLGLVVADVTSMLSAVFKGDANRLADVRAVTPGYPLRGRLVVAARPFAAGAAINDIPAAGEAWPDSRLAAALGAGVGSDLMVGSKTLRVTRILISRPDQSSTFVELAPSVLINAQDLPATRLIQPASRVRYALLLAGERTSLRKFRDWYRQHQIPGERLADVADASPQIGDASRRAARFMALASLVAVLLCAVSMAMSAASYARRQLDAVALMKTLGATRAFILATQLWQLLALALQATVVGGAIGWLTQLWLVRILRGLLRTDLPPAGALPLLIGFVIAAAMLGGFALPALLQLTRVPALRVLRRDAGPPRLTLWAATVPAVVAIFAVIYLALADWRLSLWFIGALAAAILVLAAAGSALIWVVARVRGNAGVSWRYGLANLARHRAGSIAQIVAFGLGVMLLLTLWILRNDLVTDWRASLPANVPNYFFVNIPPAQRADFSHALQAQGATLERMLPMIRGRLLAINAKPVQGLHFASPRGRGFAQREQNLSWSDTLGADNRVVAGHWWTAADAGKPLVSLATDFQQALGLKLGDRLRFDVGGENVEVTVASVRDVKWDSFRPNFFIMFPPGLLDSDAGTYMTSAFFEPRDAGAMANLVRQFPGVSIFNVGDLLAQVRTVIGRAVTAVQSVFIFTLFAGLTVLLAAVQASREERRHEIAVLRVLGARRSTILNAVLTEFASMGLLAGVLAAVGASIGGLLLAREMGLIYHFHAAVWGYGVLGTAFIVGLGGVLATRSVVNHPPRAAL